MMGSTKVIASCFFVIFTFMTILMEHSASGSTLCDCDKEEISMTYLKSVEDLMGKLKQKIISDTNDCNNDGNKDDKKDKKDYINDCQMKPMDCAEVRRSGRNKSGVYTICPKSKIINESVEVYCDMETDGGGWTVIQRRGDYGQPEDYFYKDWKNYKQGFGNIKKDFWLGNDLIYAITIQTRYSIRFDISDLKSNRVYAHYGNFSIEDEAQQYRLHIGDYSGNAGDSMDSNNNMKFSTKDRDNDQWIGGNCAKDRKGGWWYNSCSYSNLNGLYLKGKDTDTGVYWFHWKKSDESLSTTEMKIRPKTFHIV